MAGKDSEDRKNKVAPPAQNVPAEQKAAGGREEGRLRLEHSARGVRSRAAVRRLSAVVRGAGGVRVPRGRAVWDRRLTTSVVGDRVPEAAVWRRSTVASGDVPGTARRMDPRWRSPAGSCYPAQGQPRRRCLFHGGYCRD